MTRFCIESKIGKRGNNCLNEITGLFVGTIRPCLITYGTLYNSGWHYSQFFILFLHFSITINIKTFSLFISHQ
jgi:hypothetical protein